MYIQMKDRKTFHQNIEKRKSLHLLQMQGFGLQIISSPTNFE